MAAKGDGSIFKRMIRRKDGSERSVWVCQIVERVGGKRHRRTLYGATQAQVAGEARRSQGALGARTRAKRQEYRRGLLKPLARCKSGRVRRGDAPRLQVGDHATRHPVHRRAQDL